MCWYNGVWMKESSQDVSHSISSCQIASYGPIAITICFSFSDSDGTNSGQWIPCEHHFTADNMKEEILPALIVREVHSIRPYTMSLDSISSEV